MILGFSNISAISCDANYSVTAAPCSPVFEQFLETAVLSFALLFSYRYIDYENCAEVFGRKITEDLKPCCFVPVA